MSFLSHGKVANIGKLLLKSCGKPENTQKIMKSGGKPENRETSYGKPEKHKFFHGKPEPNFMSQESGNLKTVEYKAVCSD